MQSTIQKIQTPIGLGMTPLQCFYCRRFGNHHICSGDLEGIITCESHMSAGLRDCEAFLHYNHRALLRDAIEHPGLKPFFDALPATFATIRSSGAIDEGWAISDQALSCNGCISRNPAGDWCIPIEKKAEGIARGASLRTFLTAGVPGITEELVAAAIAALNSGIYRAAAEAQACIEAEAAAIGVRAETPTPRSEDGILEVMINSRLYRVLDEDGEAAAAIAKGIIPVPLL
jgi:hypothetical protein